MSKHTGLAFIIFVVVAAGIVLVVLRLQQTSDTTVTNSAVNTNAGSNANTNTPTLLADGEYRLLQTAQTNTIGEIISYVFSDGNTLSVMPEAMRSAVLNETPTLTVDSDWPVSNIIGERYTLSSAKDGSKFYVVQVIYNGQLYDFRGSDDYLANLDQYIQFN